MTKLKQTFSTFSLIAALLMAGPLKAQEHPEPQLKLCGKASQGEILQGNVKGYQSVVFNEKKYRTTKDGDFIIAFGRDQKAQAPLILLDHKGNKKEISLKINKTKWDIQNIKGLPQKKVTPSAEDEAAINKERKLVRDSLTGNMAETHWKDGFIEPVSGRISGYFGGQRIMNGKKMNPHAGTDIAAPEGTPVKATADGLITLSAPDLFYSGNVIVIDHGFGLQTVYAHLKSMNVKKGQTVKQGDIIGEVGKTGRVTGAHLHWGASLRDTRFNPYSLLNINNNNDFCFNL